MKIEYTLPGGRAVSPRAFLTQAISERHGPAPRIARLQALAHRLDGLISSGDVNDYAHLACLGHLSPARISQIMILRNLTPSLQEYVLFLSPGEARFITERNLRRIAREVRSQVDGKSHDVPLKVLPAPPVIENFPVRVNEDVSSLNFALRGERLDSLQRLEIVSGVATLGPASTDGTQRNLAIKFAPGITQGLTLAARAYVADHLEPMIIPAAVEVIGPRPAIKGLTISPVPEQSVQLVGAEVPLGQVMCAMIGAANIPNDGGIRLDCEGSTSSKALALRVGQEARGSKLERLTPDQLFLTFDSGAWFNGCNLNVKITGGDGDSASLRLVRVVGVPTVEQCALADDGKGDPIATLVGRNLETIDKAGSTADEEIPVAQLPQPLADDGCRQKLQFHVANPLAPGAVL